MAGTPLTTKTEILAELWLNYRDDPEFTDFVEYNDLGLPLAYAILQGIVNTSVSAESFIEETFNLLLAALDISEDLGYNDLYDLLGGELDV